MGYQEQAFFIAGCMIFGVAGVACAITAAVLVWGACVDTMRERRRKAKRKAWAKPRF